jgi:multisubunit Na+/H+ antiporter MnhB subunit
MATETILDGVLVVALLWLAWRVLTIEDLFQEAVLFIMFGLVMALTWARLGAPDIALAEAAIGAGVTGALILDGVGQFNDRRRRGARTDEESARPEGTRGRSELASRSPRRPSLISRRLRRTATAVVVGVIGTGLGLAVLAVPAQPGGLTREVLDNLGASGVQQPVTAVLLNFRLYDTWLELGVLVVVTFALLSLLQEADLRRLRQLPASNLVLTSATRLLVPVVVLCAGYLLWLGTHAPGGALQAGAILGAGGILLREVGFRSVAVIPGVWLRGAAVLAFGGMLIIGLAGLATGGALLELPRDWSGAAILGLEGLGGFSLAFILAFLFTATQLGRTEPGEEQAQWRDD